MIESADNMTKKGAPLFQVVKAVLWSFLGVRGQKGYEEDAAKITLKQAVIAMLVGAVIFVITVFCLVQLAIHHLSK